jgi:hypothetical protein
MSWVTFNLKGGLKAHFFMKKITAATSEYTHIQNEFPNKTYFVIFPYKKIPKFDFLLTDAFTQITFHKRINLNGFLFDIEESLTSQFNNNLSKLSNTYIQDIIN